MSDDFNEEEEEIFFKPSSANVDSSYFIAPSSANGNHVHDATSIASAASFPLESLRPVIYDDANVVLQGGDHHRHHVHTSSSPGGNGKRILLVLDLNGLLIDRVAIRTNTVTPAASLGASTADDRGKLHGKRSVVGAFYVWERRHVNDFLDFCFRRFDVGVWSSARRENVELLLRHVFGEERTRQLKLFWDQSHCTMIKPGIDVKNPSKPLFLKELSKLWRQYPVYRDGLTLLVDDTPEKARKNPPFTAIHPREWSREMRDDEGLGEGGGCEEVSGAVG